MNANHVYIVIGVAAITALIATLVMYLMGSENPAVVAGASGGATAAVIAVMIRKNKKKTDD